MDRMEDVRFDENATFREFRTLSLRDNGSTSNRFGASRRANQDVDARIRLAPKGPSQLVTSQTRANYAKLQQYKQHGIPRYTHPLRDSSACTSTVGLTTMADVETGGRRQGGGHGGRGRFNPRKRRFREGKLVALMAFAF